MPELYARAIKKWKQNFSGTVPTIDFSNGVRVGDIAIDESVSPYNQWRCDDNAIGAPVWTRIEYGKGQFSIPDNSISSLTLGNKVVDTTIALEYFLTGGSFQHEGEITLSHNGTTAHVRHMYSGSYPVHDLEVDADIVGNDLNVTFDTTAGVGTTLTFNYKVTNRI